MTAVARLDAFLDEGIRAGTFPGASYLVAEGDSVLAEGARGLAVATPERVRAATGTLYDLASLTKPLATALLVVILAGRRALRLDDRLDRHLPGWNPDDARAALTLLDLLTHRSGLPAWDPLYLHAGDVPGRIARIRALPPPHPPLMGVTYSCLNYLLLGFVLERAGGAPLSHLFRDLVVAPLGGPEILYGPPASLRPRIAATETGNARERDLAGPRGRDYNGWRRDVIRGEVHDNNAHTLGGAAGNAGLFATARGVFAVAREFLPGGIGLVSEPERALFGRSFTDGLAEARSVGFQMASTPGCSAGPSLSPAAFGHTGFTGTSLWIDPDARRIVILLTNRVHPRFVASDMNAVRRAFHALAAEI